MVHTLKLGWLNKEGIWFVIGLINLQFASGSQVSQHLDDVLGHGWGNGQVVTGGLETVLIGNPGDGVGHSFFGVENLPWEMIPASSGLSPNCFCFPLSLTEIPFSDSWFWVWLLMRMMGADSSRGAAAATAKKTANKIMDFMLRSLGNVTGK